MVYKRLERTSNLRRILIRQNPHHRERTPTTRHGALPDVLSEHPSRRLVMSNVQNPLNWPRDHLESARDSDVP